jgi:hypothetical protein
LSNTPNNSGFFYGQATPPEVNTTDELIDELTAQVATVTTAASQAQSASSAALAAAANAALAETNVSNLSAQANNTITQATAAANAASNSATQAATSASSSATQAGVATSQAGIATTQASAAATSASAASTSATAASGSQTAAAGSASAAATSATNAGNSATAAATSASNAKTSETNASGSATAAAGSATAASTSAGNASTSATNAGNSATAAATSASQAATSASNASNSATAASGSATAADTSAKAAAASAATIALPIPVTSGGTGGTSAASGRAAMGAAGLTDSNTFSGTKNTFTNGVQIGTYSNLVEISGDFYQAFNATYDGTNWQRTDTTKIAWLFQVNVANNMPYEGYKGLTTWVCQPGANPIGTWGAANGWTLIQSYSQYHDVTLGGNGFEIDGNGTVPYGRVQHATVGSLKRTGLTTNVFLDETGRDDTTKNSWGWGVEDDGSATGDLWKVRRAPSGASLAWTDLLKLSSTGLMTLPQRPVFNGNTAVDTGNIGGLISGRNRIINGSCAVGQRAAAANLTTGQAGYGNVDRFFSTNQTSTGTITMGQSQLVYNGVTLPAAYLSTTGVPGVITGSSYVGGIQQVIEGLNCYDLPGKAVAVSFVMKASAAGVYSFTLNDQGSANSFVTTFTINAANVAQQIVILVPTLPTTLNLPATTGNGLRVIIGAVNAGTYATANTGVWQTGNYIAASGAPNWMATANNSIWITNVQLEEGTIATTFERRPYPLELQLCQRYYQVIGWRLYGYINGAPLTNCLTFLTPMRVSPSFTTQALSIASNLSGSVSYYNAWGSGCMLGMSGTSSTIGDATFTVLASAELS